ncbi:outer membrane protein OmpA-like peptidoglycan-associated protein [Nocardia transvalensis]|uniref:Outer membrane protein OmpA-like peptidoglycan-associated protein n=1 Tax=Nocardia transvalensis TaxID=37333 RepID=A0A7W9P9R4_9NOCA|nr:OmpA family protein [Nocardia transvalensis]MBB5912020.1 outer membrane protein OmpA-like peptidoglycan-associated protein [Nocardia transvalensis]
MKSAGLIAGIAAATVLVTTAACSSDNSSGSATSTALSNSALRSSVAATASSMVSTALDAAQQKVQDVINGALAATPITFDSGSSDLTAIDHATLKLIAAALNGNDTRIEIHTYAEGTDPTAANALAAARGNNIAAELIDGGVDRARITVRSTANPNDPAVQVDQAHVTVVGG